jgi:hypothetical protein
MAWIVVRVILKEDAKIPHDVIVSVGMPPHEVLKLPCLCSKKEECHPAG